MREVLEDLRIEEVEDGGSLVLRLPGGSFLALNVHEELVPYYRRLIGAPEEYAGWSADEDD